jgi:Histidine kinase-, DNA gyrase B-, and HSP90-like ATPase
MPLTTVAPDASASDAALPALGSSAVPSTTAQLQRFGRRYPAVGRAAVSVVCATAAPFANPPAGIRVAVAAAVFVVGWNLVLLALLLPDRPGRPRHAWAYGVDVTLKVGLCLAQPLLVDPQLLVRSLGWISPIASFTVVAVQFVLRPLRAAVATGAIVLAYVGGVAASPGLTAVDGLVAGGAWMLVEAALARLLWVLLLRGSREADRMLQARFVAERDAATAAARRVDQRAHWATVHDTSASTLLMIGMGEVAGTEEWLQAQVRRDIALLDGPRDPGGGAVDLCGALRIVAARARVRVAMDCPSGITLPSTVAAAFAGAVAEALENVHRHAGTGAATLAVHGGDAGTVVVEVGDRGRGFDARAVPPRRFGLVRSVHDRMEAVGGRADVESTPQHGTVVRLRWAESPSAGPTEPGDRPYLAVALLRGLRVGQSVIVLTILFGLVLPGLIDDLPLYPAPWTAFAWFAALVVVAVADAVLVARHRSWGAARWPVAVAVLAVSAWATSLLPADALVGPAHLTLGVVGWFGVLLFGDRGVAHLVGFLAANVALTLVQLGLAGRLDTPTLVNLAVVVAVTAGFQLTTGVAAAALSRVADAATETARRQAATLTAEAVARQLHADREERYARLRESVLPLLRGVGDGSLSPADPEVQRRATLEAARMRRLFAEEGDVHDPLAAELGSLVEVVERRGTDVRFSARGQRPVPPPAVCRALVEEVGAALLAARRTARVTVGPVDSGVVVSIVADGGTAAAPLVPSRTEGITTVTVVDEERTWVEARWTPST